VLGTQAFVDSNTGDIDLLLGIVECLQVFDGATLGGFHRCLVHVGVSAAHRVVEMALQAVETDHVLVLQQKGSNLEWSKPAERFHHAIK
jgi:hypothetical protein